MASDRATVTAKIGDIEDKMMMMTPQSLLHHQPEARNLKHRGR
jgi:hypothetical protein